ncbi:MAG TPA: TolC family protein, partial [Bacillota bacterium]|nr:TolC family protein [Bacillota bacterium]
MLIVVCTAAFAEEVITLQEAKKIALEQSRLVQLAEDQYQANRARVQLNQARNEPQLGISLRPSTTISGDKPLQAQIGLSFSQPLPGSFALQTAKKTNELDLKMAERGLAESKRQLLLQVETAYFNLLKAEQILFASKEGVKRAQAQVETAKIQEEAGTGIRLDVMRMQVSLSRSRQSQLEAENNVRKANATLANLLGLSPETVLKTSIPDLQVTIPPLEEALSLLERRKEVLDQKAAIKKAELALDEALRNKEMNLSLFTSYSPNKSDLSVSVDRDKISANLTLSPLQDTRSSGWQIGAEARWDLADGGAKDAAVAEAQAQLASQKKQLFNLMTELEQEIRNSYWDLEAARVRLETAEANLKTSQEAWNVAKLKYDYGSGSASELLDFEVALTEAETEWINANFDYLLKQRQLLYKL